MSETSKKIFAIVGMAGSGKTEAIKYLQEKYHWPKVYMPQPLFDELERQGLEFIQDNERPLREKMRAEQGMGVMAKLSLPKIKKELEGSPVVLVESLYSWDEYKIIKREFGDIFRTIAIYSSPAARFLRLQNRPIRPLKTYEEFETRDWTEIEKTDKGGPIAIADWTLINDGKIEKLYAQIEEVIGKEDVVFAQTLRDVAGEVIDELGQIEVEG